MRTSKTIDMHMSPLPIAIKGTSLVSEALARMDRDSIGHLVVEGVDTRGLVSRAELALALRLGHDVPVDAIVERAPTVTRDALDLHVLATMRKSRATAVLVLDCDQLVGIVTATDVMRWLERELGAATPWTPDEIRVRILAEHARIRSELDVIESLAARVLEGSFEGPFLRERVRVLEGILRAHIALEEELVLPWLREADGFGDARVLHMETEHAEQRATLDLILTDLFTTRSVRELAVRAAELCRALRDDIATEERAFLTDDGPLAKLVTGGFGG